MHELEHNIVNIAPYIERKEEQEWKILNPPYHHLQDEVEEIIRISESKMETSREISKRISLAASGISTGLMPGALFATANGNDFAYGLILGVSMAATSLSFINRNNYDRLGKILGAKNVIKFPAHPRSA